MLCLHTGFSLRAWLFLILQGYTLATTLELRDECQDTAAWQTTPSAWISDNVDEELESWWQGVSSRSHQSFATELGKGFGAQSTGFECGIDDYSTCVTPGCVEYQNASDPSWSYLALVSVVNLDTFFNSLYVSTSVLLNSNIES
ncbi:hypothetical protein BDZ45DRAFT_339063 [Acephala macrosclerotiorum]|nr:hypothetical protein BDZ45DRAFT_339063 [Acephala macrosclerotiorum]